MKYASGSLWDVYGVSANMRVSWVEILENIVALVFSSFFQSRPQSCHFQNLVEFPQGWGTVLLKVFLNRQFNINVKYQEKKQDIL